VILVNGREQTHIAVGDRGLQYGDGLFETIAVVAGRPRWWQRHWQRLAAGCERLAIDCVDHTRVWDEVCKVCDGIEQGVLKVIVTRGEGGRGYRPAVGGEATRILAIYPWPNYPDAYRRQGVAMRFCTTRLGHNTALAGLKHLNRLEQVLARREWDDPEIVEGVMLDGDEHVIAGTMSNLFMVNNGQLRTPALSHCGVAGVMRGIILDLAAEAGIPREQITLNRRDLLQADEVFMTNALIGIWPVRRIEQQEYEIGPLTASLHKRLESMTASLP